MDEAIRLTCCCTLSLLAAGPQWHKETDMHRQRSALDAKRRYLDDASFTVYMDLSITLSYARRQEERSTALDTNSFRIAINCSARFQRPQPGRKSGRPLITNWLHSGCRKSFMAATTAADSFHHHYHHFVHQSIKSSTLCVPIIILTRGLTLTLHIMQTPSSDASLGQVQRACFWCKTRKRKCDKTRPKCSPMLKVSAYNCRLSPFARCIWTQQGK